MSWGKSSTDSLIPILFTPSELRQILTAYSEGVLKKGWRDYGFQTAERETLFGVIERGGHADHDDQSGYNRAILCSLTKIMPRKGAGDAAYLVCDGSCPVLKTTSFVEAVNALRAIGTQEGQSTKSAAAKKKKAALKVISSRK